MKVLVLSALLATFASAQVTPTAYNATTTTCSVSDASACANYADSCCGLIWYRLSGVLKNTPAPVCISRHLAEDISTISYTGGYTVTYQCLNTTAALGSAYTKCTNETNCTSGYCCANGNYTLGTSTTYTGKLNSTMCVPSSVGKNPGSAQSWTFSSLFPQVNVVNQYNCTTSLNTNFYSNAVLLKSAVTFAVVALFAAGF
jgi:hypothetical protein